MSALASLIHLLSDLTDLSSSRICTLLSIEHTIATRLGLGFLLALAILLALDRLVCWLVVRFPSFSGFLTALANMRSKTSLTQYPKIVQAHKNASAPSSISAPDRYPSPPLVSTSPRLDPYLPLVPDSGSDSTIGEDDDPGFKVTWTELSLLLDYGHILVVSEGRHVRNVSGWLRKHPEMAETIYNALGTNVTNDFFWLNSNLHDQSQISQASASLDQAATMLLPVPPRTSSNPNHTGLFRSKSPSLLTPSPKSTCSSPGMSTGTLPKSSDSNSSGSSSTGHFTLSSSIIPKLSKLQNQRILQARKTDIASSPQLQSLLESSPKFALLSTTFEAGHPLFSPDEFRRYALVDVKSDNIFSIRYTILRLQFALLYPQDTRINEPTEFLPGQFIELEVYLNGTNVRRYYTPIRGSMTQFEILVKLKPQGVLSNFLKVQTAGLRQYKIRGPFGVPVVDPKLPLDSKKSWSSSIPWCHDRVVMFVEDTALSVALQFLEFLFLPLNVPIQTRCSHQPQRSDELQIDLNDLVLVHQFYEDGWAKGKNLRTKAVGLFPVTIIKPRCGTDTKLTIIHSAQCLDDVFGADTLKAGLAAFRDQINIVHIFSDVCSSQEECCIVSDHSPRYSQVNEHAFRAPGQILYQTAIDSKTVESVLRHPSVGWSLPLPHQLSEPSVNEYIRRVGKMGGIYRARSLDTDHSGFARQENRRSTQRQRLIIGGSKRFCELLNGIVMRKSMVASDEVLCVICD
ncbi:uncharacterized protein BJ171DRAFT_497166 [Polychytrium aggregatum]|uniref:uncharacterized protein n=1 Tax=Polychytrium aggregatum TaxID=110093 RepID=UPI0022FE25B6|nr:uncharacterized protein BJ171DRAFT_497166 [Polychytrium aggregatum]KAI9206280.1 hypothetical protein BJ171DRAFT_497166 [Polychytrium aggregatum]